MKEGDAILVCDNESPRNQWPLAVVSKVFPSCDQLVRKVQIMTAKNEERKFFEQPLHNLVLLLENRTMRTDLYFATINTSVIRRYLIFLIVLYRLLRLLVNEETFREVL